MYQGKGRGCTKKTKISQRCRRSRRRGSCL